MLFRFACSETQDLCVCVCVNVCVCVCIYACVHMCVYNYMCTHANTKRDSVGVRKIVFNIHDMYNDLRICRQYFCVYVCVHACM